MRLHPITQLMLLAAMLLSGSEAAGLISLAKTLHDSGSLPPDAPVAIQIGLWGSIVSPPLQMVAYILEALGFALIVEVLTRILADLKSRNLALTER